MNDTEMPNGTERIPSIKLEQDAVVIAENKGTTSKNALIFVAYIVMVKDM